MHHFCPGNETLHCKENFHIENSFKIYWENDHDSGLDKEGFVQFTTLDSTRYIVRNLKCVAKDSKVNMN